MTKFDLSVLYTDETDELFDDAVRVVTEYDRASASLLQRRFSIGYTRAARLIDLLENAGVIGAGEGAKPREVLLKSFEEYKEREKKGTLPKKGLPEDMRCFGKVKGLPPNNILSSSSKSDWQHSLNDVLEKLPQNSLMFPLGFEDNGELILNSFNEIRHLIVGGSPLGEKLTFVDSLIMSLVATNVYEKLRFLFIDATHYFDLYSDLPHLLTPVISDYEKINSALKWTVMELHRRTKLFGERKVRDIDTYNKEIGWEFLPSIIVVINRVQILMDNPEIRYMIDSLVSYGYVAGIHIVLISDRLSVKDLPTTIKANIPDRVVFKTNTKIDSRQAEVKGAETLGSDEFLWRTKENPNGQKIKAIFSSEQNIKELSNWYLDK